MTTNFVDGSTVITAAWLNSVEAVREGIDAPTGKSTTANRPTPTANEIGLMYIDTTLAANGKPIWWTGTIWVDALGAAV